MAGPVYYDGVRDTSATTGTGTLTLSGTPPTGYRAWSLVGDGNTAYYYARSSDGTQWERGIGTYTASGTTLARTTVKNSSNSNNAVNFTLATTIDLIAEADFFTNSVRGDTSSNLGAGYTTTVYDNGTYTSGTLTPSMANGNIQKCVNNCTTSWTLAPPSISSGQAAHLHLVVTNNASGTLVAPSVSGFTQTTTTAYAITNSKAFDFYIYAENAFSTLTVVARP